MKKKNEWKKVNMREGVHKLAQEIVDTSQGAYGTVPELLADLVRQKHAETFKGGQQKQSNNGPI
ncbi:hypothetical protein D6789_04300 [Candidatus Woesearchaeota archaeon]|nr:MAG: hypothetical protein D6789_04300 [Candidatus Woesearchaeota archaeon]